MPKEVLGVLKCYKFFAIRYLGINGTPAIYINGMRYKGPMLKKDIKSKIDSMQQHLLFYQYHKKIPKPWAAKTTVLCIKFFCFVSVAKKY